MIQELNNIEIIEISGGHNGAAYQFGKNCRSALETNNYVNLCRSCILFYAKIINNYLNQMG